VEPTTCPWAGWAPPNLDWCEAELCAWIRNPANTWSNLAYILAAIPMWRAGGSRSRVLGWAALFVGVSSFVYHASATYVFQIGDFLGMFTFVGLPLSYNAVRLGWLRPGREGRGVLAVIAAGCSLLLVARLLTPYPIQLIVFGMILFVIAQELVIARRIAVPRRTFWIAVALLFTGAGFSSADLSRLWCDPDNHWLQGHALWHVLGAASLVALARFYRELETNAAPSESAALPSSVA
jgi:hypothetical protein